MLKSLKYNAFHQAISWILVVFTVTLHTQPASSQYQYEIQCWELAGSSEIATGLIENNEKGYLIAGTQLQADINEGTIYCINTDSTGHILWTLNLGGMGESLNGIVCENADSQYFYIYGTTLSPEFANFDTSGPFGGTYVPALYLAKITWNGSIVWEKSFREGTIFYNNTQIIAGQEGNLLLQFDKYYTESLAGLLKIDTAGNVICQKIFSPDDFQELPVSDGAMLQSVDLMNYNGQLLALLEYTIPSSELTSDVITIIVLMDSSLAVQAYTLVPDKRAVKNGSFQSLKNNIWIKFYNTWYKLDSATFTLSDSIPGFSEPELVQAGLDKYYTFVTGSFDQINVSVTNTSFGLTHHFDIIRQDKIIHPADLILSSGNKVAIAAYESPTLNINEFDISLILIDLEQFNQKPSAQYSWTIYPNPVQNELVMKAFTSLEKAEISIYGSTGQELHKETFYNTKEFRVDMSGYRSGMYYVRISSELLNNTFKILKE